MTAKKRVMVQAGEDENFRRFLYYALNPLLTYKVSEDTLRKSTQYDPRITLVYTDIFEVCDALSAMKAVDNATLYQVYGFLACVGPEERELYIKLLSKTLRFGVTAKTVNLVFPGLIPEWEVQQAYPIDKYPLRDGMWFSLTQKLNGVRATYYDGEIYARSGQVYSGIDHIIHDIQEALGSEDMVFDGELTIRHGSECSDNEAFRIATGIMNSDEPNKTLVCYTIFDCLPTNEFKNGHSNDSYRLRRNTLDEFGERLAGSNCVSVLPVLYQGCDQSKVEELLERMVREDKEGLMVNLDVPYKCTRHRGILKVKRFYTMDLPIVGYEEGSGRLAGTLGAFLLDYKGNKVGVGTGFTDEQRSDFWAKREDMIGELCEVKYKEVSYDKSTGVESLQFPVFICIREDKTEVSYG